MRHDGALSRKEAWAAAEEWVDEVYEAELPEPKPRTKRTALKGEATPPKSDRRFITVQDSDITELMDTVKNNSSGLTTWEHDFIDSIDNQLAAKSGLTEKQYDKLKDIAEDIMDNPRRW